VVCEKGREVTKGVGPTPVLHTHMPKGRTVPSCSHRTQAHGSGEHTYEYRPEA
jgi:hypothetical protein